MGISKNNQSYSQITPEEKRTIDSLNEVIKIVKYDTTVCHAYLLLGDIIYPTNPDSSIKLWTVSNKFATAKLNLTKNSKEKEKLWGLKANGLMNIAIAYKYKGNSEKALMYFQIALAINKKLGNNKGMGLILNEIGFMHYNLGNINKALYKFHESLVIRTKIDDKEGIQESVANIGVIYYQQGNIPMALEYYHKSLKIAEKNNNLMSASTILTNIGEIYKIQGDYSTALKYLNKSLKIRQGIGDKKIIATTYQKIGRIYSALNKFDISKIYLFKSLKIHLEMDNGRDLTEVYLSLGEMYFQLNEIDEAEKYYLLGLENAQKLKFKASIAKTLILLSEINLKKNQLILAHEHAKKGFDLAQELVSPSTISKSSYLLSSIYEIQGKEMKALEMYKIYITMSDSINNKANLKASTQQQAKYEYEKQKVLDDVAYDKLLAIEQEEKEKQQILTGATAGGLSLVVVFLIFVFNRLRVTKKQKEKIENQKLKVESQKKVVETAHHELKEKNQEIMDSIAYAKRIQSAILPPVQLVKEYLQESFILYKPKDIVAGDFYWLEVVNSKILFAAADCTGHGVPGAMVSVVCNNGLNRSVREYGLTNPGEILNKTREIVVQEFEKSDEEVKDGMDIALCSIEKNTLHYAGAHNPLWIIRQGEIIETKANKQPIGQFDNPEPYTTHSFDLQKEDTIYIFSDGFVDQFGGEKGKKFKAKSFRELLISVQDKNMEEQKKIINNTFETWRGSLEQVDDVCIIGVRI